MKLFESNFEERDYYVVRFLRYEDGIVYILIYISHIKLTAYLQLRAYKIWLTPRSV